MNRVVRLVAILSLLVFGVSASQQLSQAQPSNTWTVAGHLAQPRSGAAAVLLADGRVLITGGSDGAGIPQATTEIYDPATGTYTASTPMNVPRANHAAIVMRTGDVLVTGGLTTGEAYSDTAEIYSVSSRQWMLLPSPIGVGLAYQAMARLSDGNILIAGGTSTTNVVGSIVLFKLSDQSFTAIGTLLTPRTGAVAAATPDGRILIAGGADISGAVLASTEIFSYSKDTMTGTVSAGPTMTFPRMGATATSTYDGVAIIGGNNGQKDLGTAEIFSQWTNTFKVVSGGTPRSHHFAAMLPNNGSVLAMGGSGGAAVELLQPWANNKAGAFFAAADSLVNQDGGFASPASLGSLLAGGGMGNYASAAELYWFPTIATDKSDYAPGTPVQMTGTGFQPLETVTLHIHEWVKQSTDDDPDVTVVADSMGNFIYNGYAPDTDDVGARYHLTAVGMNSGFQAQAIFTDSLTYINFTNPVLDQPTAPASGAATAAQCGQLAIQVGGSSPYGTVYLTDNTSTGSFYSSLANCQSGATKITQFTPVGTSTNIWYRNSASGSPELTACNSSGGLLTCELLGLFGGAIWNSQTESIYGSPTQISFLTQPGGGAPGVAWLQQPQVAVQDANYNTVASNSDPIQLTISTNPGSGTLTCTANPSNASSGIAAFSGCLINNISSSCYVLTAKDTTLGFSATSTCFYISNPASASKSTVVANPTTVVDNGTATSTITVTLKDLNGNAVVGKTVTLGAGTGNSTINVVSGTSNASGVATFTVSDATQEVVTYTAFDSTDGVTITQTAAVTFAAGQVSAGSSTVSRNPATVNADGVSSSTITVTLHDSSDDPISGETVTLSQGSGHSIITPASTTTDANGVATFTVTDTTVENVTYTANYSGANGTGSLTTHTVSVNFTGIGTSLTLSVNPNNTTSNVTIVLTSGLSVTLGGSPLGGVSVSFYESAGTCSAASTLVGSATTDGGGTATFNWSMALAAGTYHICAVSAQTAISGVTYSSASSSSQNLVVANTATTLTWTTAPPGSANYNASFLVTATTNSCATVNYAVTGGCSVSGNRITMTSGTTACQVSANVSARVCSGTQYAAATLGPVTVTANLIAQTALVLHSNPTLPGLVGNGATITMSTTGGSGSGAVTYGVTGACTVSGNLVTMNNSGSTPATCTVTATKASDGNYSSATSNSLTATTNGTASVTITNTSQTYTGSALPVTVTTSPPGLGVSVTYSNSGTTTTCGTVADPNCPTNGPTLVGTYSVTATVTSPGITGTRTATETVSKTSAGLTLGIQSGTSNPAPYGTMDYFVLTLNSCTPGNGPTGAVQLVVDGTPVTGTGGTGTLDGSCTAFVFSTATIEPSPLAHQLVVQYAGDSNYPQGNSNTYLFTVNADTTQVTLSALPMTINVGGSVVFTATVTPGTLDPSANIPQGTVQFNVDGAVVDTETLPSASPYTVTFTDSSLTSGSHNVYATYVPGTDQEFSGQSSTITVETVSLITPKITWGPLDNIVYGTPLGDVQLNATATDPTSGDTVPGTFVYTPAANFVLGVGPTTLSVTFTPSTSAAATYSPITVTVQITVTPVALTVTADNQTMAYGAAVPTLTYQISGFVAGDVPSQVTGTAACSITGSTPYTVNGSPYTISCQKGTLSEPNYTFTTFNNGQLTVTTATPTLTLLCPEVPYDGASHGCQGVAIGADGTTQVAGSFTFTYNGNSAPPTDAGTYTVVGTFNSSDTGGDYVTPDTKNATLIIDQATSSVTLTCPASEPYNGTAWTPCTATATGAGGLNQSLTSAIGYSNNTNAGTATATVSYTGDTDHSPSSNTVTFAISPESLTAVAGNYTWVYNGSTELIPQPCTLTGGTYTTGLTCVNQPATPVGPDVSSGAVTPQVNGANSNFTITPFPGTWSITQAASTVTITCPLSGVAYNGQAQTPCTATVTGVGLSQDVTSSIVYANNTIVGTASATVNFLGDTDHAPSSSTVNFAINKATSSVSVTCTPSSVTYNGLVQKPCTATATGIGGLNQSAPVTYTPNANPTNVSTYTATGNFTGDANHSASSNTNTFTITAAQVTATAGSYNGVYDTATHPLSACVVTGLFTGTLSCTNSPLGPVGPNVQTATAVAAIPAVVSPDLLTNYSITLQPGSWSITPAIATVTLVSNLTQFYTGSPATPVTVSTAPGGLAVSLLYGTVANPTIPTSATPPTPVGNYAVLATVTTPDYAGSMGTGTLSILAKSPGLSLTLQSGTPNPAPYGTNAVFVLTLPDQPECPTGTVQFYIDGGAVGSLVTLTPSSCSAPIIYQTNTLSVASHPVTAVFVSTDPNITGGTATLAPTPNYTVTTDATSLVVTGPATVNVGSAASFTALLSLAVAPGSGNLVPQGTVELFDTFGGNTTQIASGPLQQFGSTFLAILPATFSASGAHSISATFVPTDSAEYPTSSTQVAVTVTVDTVVPKITWANPANIVYGTALSATQLTASATDPSSTGPVLGNFVFTPPTGTVLNAGPTSLSVLFTPNNLAYYSTATATVPLTVLQAPSTVTVTCPTTAVTYTGSALTPCTAVATGVNLNLSLTSSISYSNNTNAGPATASVTFAGDANHSGNSGSGTFTIAKATPTVSAWPTASAIIFGQTLASSTLTGGTASVAGTFTWTTPTTAPAPGAIAESVTFTPTNTADYNTVTGSVTVTVNKATPTVSAWPTASAITFGQTLASSTLAGGTASVAGTFHWTTPTTAPGAGTPSESVTFTPTNTTNYNTVIGSVTVTVNKATPTVSAWPAASAITYGQTLASSTLTGGTASVPGTFAWTTSTTAPIAGAPSESVTFTPTDTTDYNTVTGSVTVTVRKATPTVSAWPTASAITFGQTLASSNLTGGTASVAGTFAWTTATTAPGAGTPSESVTFTPTNAANYNTVTGSITVTVNKATPTVSAWPTPSTITFGQTLASSTLTGGTASVAGTFTWTSPTTAPGVGATSESVTFTPTNTANYITVTGSVTVTVNKATPTVSAWPTPSTITFGQTLASSTLTGGTASVPGTFAWTTSTTAPTAGSHAESVTFTPTNTTDYNAVTGSVTVTVNKATPTVSAWPTANPITFGQTLASSTLTGGTASVAGTFTWTTPTTAPGVGATSESVTFTPTNAANYNTVTGSVTITVNKATPTVSAWPTASAITFGQTLASSTLTGGTASVAGTFTWTTPTTAPGPGAPSESVTFTPTNTTNYNTVTGSVTVTVNKATPTVLAWPTASAINFGQTLASSTLTGGTASVSGTFAWTTPTTAPGAGAPSESVTFTPTNTTDYNTVTGSVTVTVNKATPTVSAWPTAGAINFGQTLSSSALTGGTASVAGTFAWTTSTTAPGAGTPSESVTFTPTNAANYNSVTGSVTVTVNKGTPTVSVWPTASAITYGQSLASSTLSGGTASVGGTFTWTTSTTVPGAGTPSESVTFTPTDATDYNTATGSVTVTVNKATPTVSAWPTAGAITVGQTLASSTLTGGTASVAGTFAWTTPTTAPGAGTPSESATFTPTDTTDYNTVTGLVTVTVSKATPTVSAWPTAGAITFGQTLASSTLTGGTASVAGTFTWTTPTTAPGAGTPSESVTFAPSDAADYNTVTALVTVTVRKATPTVSAWPTAGAITAGQTLSSSILSGGTASVAGTFAWTTPTTAPAAGTPSESVTFTPTDATDYNTVTGSVTVTVNKATPTVSAWPTASAITYGQSLASSTLSGGTASVAGTFAWTTSTTVPGAGTTPESVTFTPTDTADYNTVAGSVTVTVSKATPTVSVWPTAGAISVGQTLASSPLTGGTASVAGTFAWTTPATAPGAGTPAESVTFTPTDTTDYNTVTGSVTVTVNKATPTVSAWPTATAINYGQTLSSSTLTGGTASVAGTFTWTTPATAPGAGTPSESVTFTPTDTTDYNTVTGSVTVTVNKATPTVSAWPTAGAINFGQTLSSSTLTGGTASVAGTFAWTTSTTAPGAGTPSESVTFTPTDTTDFNTVTGSITVTVRKATLTVSSWPTAGAITYGQTLSSSPLTGGTASVAGTFAWTTPATVAGAGTPSESVTFTPTDIADYNTATASITITVNKATPTVSVWPTAGAITIGQTLSSSALAGGTASVPGTFVWTTPTTAPPLGPSSESVIFTPTDTTDYNTVTGSVTVTVNNKTTPTVSLWPTAGAITYGQTLASSTLTGGTASVAGTFAWTTSTTAPGAGTPSESVTFTPTDTTIYNTATGSVTVTVSKATPTVSAWPTAGAITYGQTLSSSTLSGGTASVAGTFAWTTSTTAPPLGPSSESVTFTPTDTTDYNAVTGSVTVTVNKATPTVSAWPTAGTITVGQTLSSSTLSGGTASVAGTFAWTTPTTAPGAGTPSESVTFTPTDTTDYNAVTGSVTVTVNKAAPTVSAWPTAGTITVGQTLSSSTLTGGTASVTGTFAWTTSSTAPGAGTPSESVTFTPTDTTDYNTVTGSVTVTVNKATPTVSVWPTANSITLGQTLASSTLTGGTASVAGSFAWTTSTTAPPLGPSSESVTFTPTDTTDYNTVTGSVTVTVNNKTTPTVSAWPTPSAITYGQTLSSSTLSGGTASVTGTFAWTTSTTAPGAGTPSESVTFTPTDTTTYNTATGSVTVTVNKATPTVSVWPTANSITLGQTLASSTLSGGTASVAGTFAWTTSTTAPPLGPSSESVTFTPTDTTDYNTVTGSATVTVNNKTTPTVSVWPTPSAITYGQTLASSTLTGGTASVAGTFAWTTSTTAPGAGTPSESVTFTPTDTTTYNTATGSVTITVNKATPTVSVWPTANSITLGQTLSSSTLTGGTASVAGIFAWTTPTIAPGVGTPSESVIFTPTDATDYNTVTGSVTITVNNKTAPTVSAWPIPSAIAYGQTLASSTLTGGTASVAGTFAWTTSTTAPGAGTPSESVTFTPTDTTTYNTATGSVTITVNKATPTVSVWPTANSITLGQTLASSTLSGGTASVAGSFAWTTSTIAPGVGTPSESVTFTPTDATDYNTVTGSVTITVNNKTAPTVSAWPIPSAIAYGQTLASSTLSGGTASVAGTFAWTTSTTAPGAGTPSESVTFTPTDTTSYNTATGSVTVTVNKATPTVSVWPTANSITLGETLASSTLSGGTASVAGSFAWTTSTTAPPLGPSPESVTFTPTDTADYNTVTGSVTITVNNKTAPTVSAWPTPSAITYGQTLASSTLSGGAASVAGSFAWTTSTTAPGAGTPSESVTFTPTDTTTYNTATGSVTITVNKATPTVSVWPTANSITLGETLASSTLAGGTASVAGTFAWTTSTTAPPLGPSSESVIFTPTDTANYNTVTGSVTITVNNKTTPTVSVWPTASAITYGQTLASSTLTGGTASVAGTFAWTTSSTAPGAGTPSESVTFTPTDTTSYNTATGSVTITVNKATPTVSVWPTANAITLGETLASSTLSGGTASVAGTFAWTTSTTAPPLGPSPESVIFTPTDTADYNTVTGSVTITVNNKTTPTVSVWPTASAITYGQTLASSTLTGGTASVAGTFAWTTSSTAPGAGTPSESVTFTPTDTTSYNTATGSVTITVNKATPTVSVWPTANAITLGETLASSTLSGGTASVAGTFAWTTSTTAPPLGPSPESVIFTPTDTADYNTVTGSVTVTVNNKTTPTVSAWPTPSSITYGQTLASSTLTGGTASVAGTFAWTTSTTAPGAGTPSESVTFTPTDTTTYNTATGSVTITVNKATPTVSVWPTANAITLGETLASSTLSGGTASVAGTFAWTTTTTAPPLGPSSESVIFTPTDVTDYNTVTGSVTITVNNKTAPTVSAWPIPSAITYGQTLASSTLSGGTASVAGTFAWTTSSTAPGAGTPSESVTFTPTDTTTYNTATGSVTITVNKATPTVSVWPTANSITLGETLASSTLSGGTASVAGSFAWTTSTTAPPLGPSSEGVTFTPTDTTDYNTVAGSVTVTVNNKTTPTVSVWPTASSITYGQTLASSTLSGGTASVAGTFAWTTSTTAPGAGTPSESVTFTPTDTTTYNAATGSITVTVNKATPTVSVWPTANAITLGETLASSTLSGGTASVAGTFAWTTSTTAPPLGPSSESVIFTPTDATDYNTVTGSVTITVNNKTAPTVSAWPTPSAITYGQTLSSSTLTGGTASVAGSFAWTTSTTAPGAGTPSESVTFTPTDTTNYNTAIGSVTVTVNKATPTVSVWPAANSITLGQTLASSTLSGGTASVAGTFAWATSTTAPPLGPSSESVIFTPTDTTDYNTVTGSVTVTVNNVPSSVTTVTCPPSVIYSGAAQTPCTAKVTGSGGLNQSLTVSYTNNTNAGTATASASFAGDTDNPASSNSASFTINAASQAITFPQPSSPVIYGVSPVFLAATGGVSGKPVVFSIDASSTGSGTISGGMLVVTGAGNLIIDANQAGDSNYLAATQVTRTIVVNLAALTVSANSASRVYGTNNPTFSGSATGALNGDTFTESYLTIATISSNVGTYPIVPSVTGANLTDYAVTVQNGTLTVTQAGTTTSMNAGSSSATPGQSVTLTAQVVPVTSGTPTGSVAFYDGATLLGTSSLTAGTATLSTTSLTAGASNTLQAVYSGDNNFTTSTSSTSSVSVAPLDYTLTVSGPSSLAVTRGTSATYQVAVAPLYGNYPGTVSFAASGQPNGGSITFSPSTIAFNGGKQTVNLTVQTPALAKEVPPSLGRKLAPLTLAWLLIPLFGVGRLRKQGRRLTRLASLLLLLACTLTGAMMTGCGGASFKQAAEQDYTILVTTTSGNMQHTASVTLQVK